jgi:ubiquinone/menaquinone biosynthesis C-methylase UbiE
MNTTIATSMSPEMEALKTRLKATWMSGDYGVFAKYLEPGALKFLDGLKIKPGTRLLDLGCGAGQIAIPAAKAGVKVTGVDLAANLIEQAKARASAEGVQLSFEEGDAEALVFEDASFDMVVSLIGAMFAPRPDLVASEMLRVCRPGGRIVMANWTAQGFVGQMFKTIGKHVPPPPIMASPLLWGDEAKVRERFGAGVSSLETSKRMYRFHYPFAPDEVVDFFITYYGPTNRAYAALDAAGKAAMHSDLVQLWASSNLAKDGSTQVESEYLEVQAQRA